MRAGGLETHNANTWLCRDCRYETGRIVVEHLAWADRLILCYLKTLVVLRLELATLDKIKLLIPDTLVPSLAEVMMQSAFSFSHQIAGMSVRSS
jgi:hypothetical protein